MTTAQALIATIHRLSTLEPFSRESIEAVLGTTLYPATGTSPEHVVSTAAFEDGPFASAELIEPGPYSRLVERRLVLTPSGSLPFEEISGWYGPGTPMQIDGRAEQPLATIAYDVQGQEILFSFAVEEGDVRFVTIRRAR